MTFAGLFLELGSPICFAGSSRLEPHADKAEGVGIGSHLICRASVAPRQLQALAVRPGKSFAGGLRFKPKTLGINFSDLKKQVFKSMVMLALHLSPFYEANTMVHAPGVARWRRFQARDIPF